MTDLQKAAQAVVAALEKAPYLRHEAIDALRAALAQPEQQAEPADERAAFERWAGDQGFPLRLIDEDNPGYLDLRTQGTWDAWQARATQTAHPPAQPIEPGNLYWRLHSLSKVLESSGRIDEHEQKGAYATILDAMNHVRSKP